MPRVAGSGERELIVAIGSHRGEGMVLRTPVEEVRVAERSSARADPALASGRNLHLLCRPHQLVRLREGQGPQQDRIHQAEDGGGRSDAECQGKHSREREAWALAELAEGKS